MIDREKIIYIAITLVGLFVVATGVEICCLWYTGFTYEKIHDGMSENEVDRVCGGFKKRIVSLEQTSWLKQSTIVPKSYGKIVIYEFFSEVPPANTIEVVYSQDHKVVVVLPSYE